MNQKMLKKIIRNLQSKVKCPVCGHKFKKEEINFRGFFQDIYLFEFGCPTCSTLLYAKVMVDEVNNKKTEEKPLEKPQNKSTDYSFRQPRTDITSNEIIELHRQIDKFDDSLEKLF